MISIICAYRDRPEQLAEFIVHYKSQYPEAEILIINQADHSPFLRGQLFNIGFMFARYDVLLLVDVDIRLKTKLDLVGMAQSQPKPVVLQNRVEMYRLDKAKYVPTGQPPVLKAQGGIHLFTRAQYEAINGYSNCYIGHSCEDGDIDMRGALPRYENTVIHLEHPIGPNKLNEAHRNWVVGSRRSERDFQLDGFRQTAFSLMSTEWLTPTVVKYNVNHITVCPDFAYKNFLEPMQELQKQKPTKVAHPFLGLY